LILDCCLWGWGGGWKHNYKMDALNVLLKATNKATVEKIISIIFLSRNSYKQFCNEDNQTCVQSVQNLLNLTYEEAKKVLTLT
jgi:flagellar biosynthesis protein FlhB